MSFLNPDGKRVVPDKKFAVAYLRVSTDQQADAGGFPRQRESIYEYAKRNNIVILHEYADDCSGTIPLKDRPQASKMFSDVLQDGIKIVLIENTDRWARDMLIAEVAWMQYKEMGVSVITSQDGINLTDEETAHSKFIRRVLAAASDLDREQGLARRNHGRRLWIAAGNRPGKKLIGEGPGDADTLKRIKELCDRQADGRFLTVIEIVRRLNEEGYRTQATRSFPAGRPFLCRQCSNWIKAALGGRTVSAYRHEIKMRERRARKKAEEDALRINER